MATAPLANSFVGTDGVAISAANSGGSSGDAFTSVSATSPTTVSYSTARAHSFDSCMRVVTGATFDNGNVNWGGLGLPAGVDGYDRIYVWLPALPTANGLLFRALTAAAAVCAQLELSTAGIIQGANAAQSGIPASAGTVPIATGRWVRVEWRVRASTTVGQIEWRLFNEPESTVPSDQGIATGQVLGADLGELQAGMVGFGPINTTRDFDDRAVSTTGWPGPLKKLRTDVSRFPKSKLRRAA